MSLDYGDMKVCYLLCAWVKWRQKVKHTRPSRQFIIILSMFSVEKTNQRLDNEKFPPAFNKRYRHQSHGFCQTAKPGSWGALLICLGLLLKPGNSHQTAPYTAPQPVIGQKAIPPSSIEVNGAMAQLRGNSIQWTWFWHGEEGIQCEAECPLPIAC